MAYPPTVPPNTRADATLMATNHKDDHNALSNALTDILNELGADPAGAFASLTARLVDIEADIATLSGGGSTVVEAPVGSMVEYIGTTDPADGNWLISDGRTITDAQTLYPDLWAVAPASQKSGADLTLIDTRQRVGAGYDSGDTAFDAIGETGGSRDAVVVAHSHSVSGSTSTTGSHTHTDSTRSTTAGATSGSNVNANVGNTSTTTSSSGSHSHSVSGTALSTGSSATDANLPPYYVVCKIIRVQ